jgi:hypothetical protein
VCDVYVVRSSSKCIFKEVTSVNMVTHDAIVIKLFLLCSILSLSRAAVLRLKKVAFC